MAITNLGSGSSILGVGGLHVSRVTTDTPAEFVGDLPKAYDGLNQANLTVNGSKVTYNADNRVYESDYSVTDAQAQFDVAGLTPEWDEYVMGLVRDGLAQEFVNAPGLPVLFKYEIELIDNTVIFYQVGVCKAQPTNTSAQTKSGSSKGAQVTAEISPPKNGSMGAIGIVKIASNDPLVKTAGLTVQQLRDYVYGSFLFKDIAITATAATGGTAPVPGIPYSFTVAPSQTDQLTVKDNINKNVTADCTFAVADPSVATVSATGLVTAGATAGGNTSITITYKGKTQTINITVS